MTSSPFRRVRPVQWWAAGLACLLILGGGAIRCCAAELVSAANGQGCSAPRPIHFLSATSPGAADPDDFYTQALTFASARNDRGAQRAFELAFNLSPEKEKYVRALTLFYIERARYDEAIDVIARHVKLCGATATGYELEAELLFKKRMFEPALEAAVRSLDLFNGAARPHELLGLIFVAKRQTAAAAIELGKAVALDPNQPRIRYLYGRLLYAAGRYQEASEQLVTCLRIQPGFPRALENLGLTYERIGNTNAAIQAYRDAIANYAATPEVKNVEPHACYAALLAKLGKPEEAVDLLRRARAISPNSFRTNFELGRLLLSAGKYDEAEEYLLAAANLAPTFSRTYFLLGKLYRKQNRPADAEAFWARFTELDKDPNNREIPLTDR